MSTAASIALLRVLTRAQVAALVADSNVYGDSETAEVIGRNGRLVKVETIPGSVFAVWEFGFRDADGRPEVGRIFLSIDETTGFKVDF